MCLVYDNNQFGLAITDISTGDFYTTEVATLKELYDEIHRFSPSEIICNDSFYMSGASLDDFKDRLHVSVSTLDTWYMDEAVSVQKIKEHFKVASLDGLGLTDFPSGTLAVGALLLYLYETQKNTLDNLTKITPYRSGGYMIIDSATNRNLELIGNTNNNTTFCRSVQFCNRQSIYFRSQSELFRLFVSILPGRTVKY